jgi:hypothetical protein
MFGILHLVVIYIEDVQQLDYNLNESEDDLFSVETCVLIST